MGSIATIVTLGYGSFGSVNLLPTLGYSLGGDAPNIGPLRTLAAAYYESGAAIGIYFQPGALAAMSHQAGATEGEYA